MHVLIYLPVEIPLLQIQMNSLPRLQKKFEIQTQNADSTSVQDPIKEVELCLEEALVEQKDAVPVEKLYLLAWKMQLIDDEALTRKKLFT